MRLTNMEVKNARYGEGKNKRFDGGGLFLWLKPSGSKLWRYKYRFNGKEQGLALGQYPMVLLSDARDQHRRAKAQLREGIDPNQQRKDNRAKTAQKQEQAAEQAMADSITFEVVALEWLETRKEKLNEKYRHEIRQRFNNHVFSTIGKIPIARIERVVMVDLLLSIAHKKDGTPQIAQRVIIQCNSVLRYAISRGVLSVAPIIENISELLPKIETKPMPAITSPKRIGELLRAIDEYKGSFVVCCALKLLPYLFVRAGEFRTAQWQELDLDAALWTIPAAHRKLKKAKQEESSNVHYVPLRALDPLDDIPIFMPSAWQFAS